MSLVRGAVAIAAGVMTVCGVQAQEPPRFKSGVDVVTVTATVTDRDGRFAAGLMKSDFAIFEDGRARDIIYFADESVPVSLGILLDASGSMSVGKLGLARESISRLVTHDLDPMSEWFFARFGYSLVMTQEWTRDRDAIVQALREVRATGDTALYDAIALAIPLAEDGHFQKKALLLVSDGGESKSLLSLDEVQKAIGESDVRVYGIGVDATDSRRGERLNMKTLQRVADDTGGSTEIVANSAAIPAATARIADELRHQYLLSYSTDVPKDGRRHTIRVDVRGRGLKVRARRGFVAN
jgi:Ca-activated chloride channel family protein